MSSLAVSRKEAAAVESALYLATGAALSSALLAAGWGSGSPRVGVIGAVLAGLGVWVSWKTRRWPRRPRFVLGVLAGLLAAGCVQALIAWEIGAEVGSLYVAQSDIGLSLALRMGVLLIAFSFLLVTREALPFSLVPGLALFGLSGGRGATFVAFGCFLVFFPAALISVEQAMSLSGIPVDRALARSPVDFRRWRRRHWLMTSSLISAILLLGSAIYVPAVTYGTQYYWQLAMMNFDSPGGFGSALRARPTTDLGHTYSVGRGPIVPADRPVFTFDGQPADLWRGEVYDTYTGSTWRSSDEAPLPVRVSDGAFSLARLFPPEAADGLSRNTVRAEIDLPPVILSPGRVYEGVLPPAFASSATEGLYVDKFGCVFAPGATLRGGLRYQIASQAVEPWRARAVSRGDALSGIGDVDQSYLRIPVTTRRVADLSRRIVQGLNTPAERIAALVSYIQQNCAYTLNAPAVPAGEDAADFFLFHSRRGYCDLFATTLAMMGRAAGVPTRFVTGFAGGTYDPGTGRYVVRESDAHAWVETYLPAQGWVTVEATPGGGPAPIPPLQHAYLAIRFFLQDHPAVTLALGVIVFASLLVGILQFRRLRRREPSLFGDRADPRSVIIRAYARLIRTLGKRIRSRRPTETPLEYLHALETGAAVPRGRRPAIPSDGLTPIRSLTEIFVRARYGTGAVPVETAAAALDYLRQAQLALRSSAPPS